jgi:hypothetical protein
LTDPGANRLQGVWHGHPLTYIVVSFLPRNGGI